MGAIENAKAYGLTLRESADDGSDFTNPDADYRRLFLGEDGQLHVKDSAGAVTGIGGAVADILDLDTAETDDTLVLAPDGAGGVEFRAEAGGGLDTGTTFHVSPTTGDRYRRSDLDYQIFFYDGTRWVSEEIHTMRFGLTANSSAAVAAYGSPISGLDMYLLDLRAAIYVATTLDGSKYWTAKLQKRANLASAVVDVGSALSTTGGTPSAINVVTGALDTVVTAATAGEFRVLFEKVSTPGDIGASTSATVTYRLIAT